MKQTNYDEYLKKASVEISIGREVLSKKKCSDDISLSRRKSSSYYN